MTAPRLGVLVVVVALAVVAAIDLGLPAGPLLEGVVLVAATTVGLTAAHRLQVAGREPARRRASRVEVDPPLHLAVSEGLASSGGLHHRLVPVLRPLAQHRCERHGTSLDDPVGARSLLGPELHDLVRPDRPRPRDRDAPGVDPALLARAVDRLAAL